VSRKVVEVAGRDLATAVAMCEGIDNADQEFIAGS
jgi:hypothetical protein